MSTGSVKSEAIVIRQAEFSESSRVVTFFSRDFGKVSALAKGAKRLKGSFEAGIDLLNRCRIVFLHKSTDRLDLLTEAKLVDRFRTQSRDVNSYYAGLYVAELLDLFTEEFDPHPQWYDATVVTLQRLQTTTDIPLAVLRFELVTLSELGLIPDFEQCQCGRPVEPNRDRWSMWIQQGVLLCSQCRKSEVAKRPLTGEVLVRLRAVLETDIHDEIPDSIPPANMQIIRPMITALLSNILDRRPKMLAYLKL